MKSSKYKAGDLVRISTGEAGCVVWSWLNEEFDVVEYYVAFFGTKLPEGKPSEKPYVLRFAETSISAFDP